MTAEQQAKVLEDQRLYLELFEKYFSKPPKITFNQVDTWINNYVNTLNQELGLSITYILEMDSSRCAFSITTIIGKHSFQCMLDPSYLEDSKIPETMLKNFLKNMVLDTIVAIGK